MVGAVNHQIPYTNPHPDKAETRQNRPVTVDSKVGNLSKEDHSKPLVAQYDEYVHSDGTSEKFPGIYRLEKDENGKQKIVFDRPDSEKADAPADSASEDAQTAKPPVDTLEPVDVEGVDAPLPKRPEKENGPEKPGDKESGMYCSVNTDKVDAEIKKLQTQKQQAQQELNRARGNEDAQKEAEQHLAQIEAELSAKDNDAYRKANASFTYSSTPI